MRRVRREQPFWRERDPQPNPVDAETHARLRNGNPLSHQNLGAPTYDKSIQSGAIGGPGDRPVAGIVVKESAAGPLKSQAEVCARLRVSRITLWRMVKRGEFPPPVDVGKRRAVWRAVDLNAWCKVNARHFERVIARKLPAAIHR